MNIRKILAVVGVSLLTAFSAVPFSAFCIQSSDGGVSVADEADEKGIGISVGVMALGGVAVVAFRKNQNK